MDLRMDIMREKVVINRWLDEEIQKPISEFERPLLEFEETRENWCPQDVPSTP